MRLASPCPSSIGKPGRMARLVAHRATAAAAAHSRCAHAATAATAAARSRYAHAANAAADAHRRARGVPPPCRGRRRCRRRRRRRRRSGRLGRLRRPGLGKSC